MKIIVKKITLKFKYENVTGEIQQHLSIEFHFIESHTVLILEWR